MTMLAAVERRRCESRARWATGSMEAWRLMVLRIGDKGTGARATVKGHGGDEGGVPSRFDSRKLRMPRVSAAVTSFTG